VWQSKAISVGWTSRANRTPQASNSSKMGVQSRTISPKASSIICSVVGGNEYQYFHTGEPMKPVTTLHPMARAARAVVFISWTAQARILSGWPLQSVGAKVSRRGSHRSPTHCPARCAPRAWTTSLCSASTAFLRRTYSGSEAAFCTSR
jgi:hypothetical protein